MFFKYNENSEIHYSTYGAGPTALVFLHGLGASIYTWKNLVPFFPSNKFKLYLVDLKGHGRSSCNPDDDYSILEQANMVLRFIAHINHTHLILIGHSYGGGIALIGKLKAHQDNYRIAGLVLIDPGVFVEQIPFFVKILNNPIKAQLSRIFFSPRTRAKVVLRTLYHNANLVTEDAINNYSKYYRNEQWNVLVKAANTIIPEEYPQFLQNYSSVTIPTLIIWGEKDPIFSVELGYRLHSLLPNSDLKIVQNTGHIPNEESPMVVYTLIMEYLFKNKLVDGSNH